MKHAVLARAVIGSFLVVLPACGSGDGSQDVHDASATTGAGGFGTSGNGGSAASSTASSASGSTGGAGTGGAGPSSCPPPPACDAAPPDPGSSVDWNHLESNLI